MSYTCITGISEQSHGAAEIRSWGRPSRSWSPIVYANTPAGSCSWCACVQPGSSQRLSLTMIPRHQ
jgi:hypothetical protein